MIGHFSEDGFKCLHGFVGSPGAGQQHSQVRQRRNDIRIKPERQTVFLLGIVELSPLIKNCPEQVVSVRIARYYGDYLPQNWFRFIQLAELKQARSFTQLRDDHLCGDFAILPGKRR